MCEDAAALRDEHIEWLVDALPRLQHLTLDNALRLTEAAAQHLVMGAKQLKSLEVGQPRAFTLTALLALFPVQSVEIAQCLEPLLSAWQTVHAGVTVAHASAKLQPMNVT